MDENENGMGESQKTTVGPWKGTVFFRGELLIFREVKTIGIASTQMMWDLYITLHSQHGFWPHIKIVALNHCCFQHQKTKTWPPQKRFLLSLRSDFHELFFGIFFSDTSPFMEDLPTLHLQLPNCCLFHFSFFFFNASSHGWKPKKYPVWKGSSSEPTLLIFQELEPL